jgi:hypothetical protein
LFAGAATIVVYKRGEKFQRQLVRPLLAVRHIVIPGPETLTWWIVEIKNEGQGAANIDAITVVAGQEILEPEPLQSPSEYWQSVLYGLGILAVHHVEANIVAPPLSIGSGSGVVQSCF